MKKSMIISMFLVFCCIFSFANEYKNLEYHFSFTLPDEWKEISKTEIDEMINQIPNNVMLSLFNIVDCFEIPEGNANPNSRLMIQYIDLSGIEMEWDTFVKSIVNADIYSILEDTGLSPYIDNIDSNFPIIDNAKKILVLFSEVYAINKQSIKIISIIHLGRSGVVQILIFLSEKEEDIGLTLLGGIIETLQFDDAHSYVDKD